MLFEFGAQSSSSPDHSPAIIVPVVVGVCLVALAVGLVGVFAYRRRRWGRLREFVDVRVTFADPAPPGADSVAAAIASSLRAPRVAAVGLKGDREARAALVRVHDARQRSTGEVRRVTEELLAWASKGVAGSTLAGRKVAFAELLRQPAAAKSTVDGSDFYSSRVNIAL
eukprot:tig00021221_g19341.t1